VFEKSFRDHHAYSQSDVDALTASAKRAGAHFVITTEKDAVKLTKLHFELPCCILETALSIENGDALKQLVVAVSNSQTDLRGLKR
jgi:tetraacyldisaccharide 4'-kinase